MSTDTATNKRPLIQIDDLVREMTDEEYADYLTWQANAPAPLFPHETPTSNP